MRRGLFESVLIMAAKDLEPPGTSLGAEHIRPAQRRDLPAILTIERDSFAQPWTRGMFLEELAKNPPTLYVIAEIEGPVRGYLCFWSVAGEVQLVNLAVDPTYRQRGLGRRLMTFLIEEGRHWGAEKIFLEVRPSNRTALGLYTRMGFQTLYRRPGYYPAEGEDALVMVLAIPSA